jgi:hypothetical protein
MNYTNVRDSAVKESLVRLFLKGLSENMLGAYGYDVWVTPDYNGGGAVGVLADALEEEGVAGPERGIAEIVHDIAWRLCLTGILRPTKAVLPFLSPTATEDEEMRYRDSLDTPDGDGSGYALTAYGRHQLASAAQWDISQIVVYL